MKGNMKGKMKLLIFIQFAVFLAAIVAFFLYTEKEVAPVKVFVYASDMSENQVITEENIQQIEIPAKAVHNGFALNAKDIIGKFAGSSIGQGQYVYKSQLIEEEEKDIFADMDMTNYRKIPLPISYATSFGGDLQRGDAVDLVFTGDGAARNDDGQDVSFRYSKTFLSNVLVYNVSTGKGYPFKSHADVDFTKNKVNAEQMDTPNHQDPAILTLLVTLDQAEEILTRQESGSIRIVGRFDDSESYETLGFVYGEYEKVFTTSANAETGRGTVQ